MGNEAKIGLVNFFRESTYQDAKGESRPCYQVTKKGENNMFTQQKELTQEQIADAKKLCQLKQSTQAVEWPLLRIILMAYIDGVGTGMQLSGKETE